MPVLLYAQIERGTVRDIESVFGETLHILKLSTHSPRSASIRWLVGRMIGRGSILTPRMHSGGAVDAACVSQKQQLGKHAVNGCRRQTVGAGQVFVESLFCQNASVAA